MSQTRRHSLSLHELLNIAAWRLPGQPEHHRTILQGLFQPLGVFIMAFAMVLLLFGAYRLVLSLLIGAFLSIPGVSQGQAQSFVFFPWLMFHVLVLLTSPFWSLWLLSERIDRPTRFMGRDLLVQVLSRLAPLASDDEPLTFDNQSPAPEVADAVRWHLALPTQRGRGQKLICTADVVSDRVEYAVHWQGEDNNSLLKSVWERREGQWRDSDGRTCADPAMQTAHEMALALYRKFDVASPIPEQILRVERQASVEPPARSEGDVRAPFRLRLRDSGVALSQPGWRLPSPSVGDVFYVVLNGVTILGFFGLSLFLLGEADNLLDSQDPVLEGAIMCGFLAAVALFWALYHRFPHGTQLLPLRARPFKARASQQHLRFDGRRLIREPQAIDLDSPFTLNLSQPPPSASHDSLAGATADVSWLTLELVQVDADGSPRRLCVRCRAIRDETLPTLEQTAYGVEAAEVHRLLWPVLQRKLDAHGRKPRYTLVLEDRHNLS